VTAVKTQGGLYLGGFEEEELGAVPFRRVGAGNVG
jgi:hypothetical protein